MNDAPLGESADRPPELRFLKVLVSVLAGTMILGLITIIALIVIRFPTAMSSRPALPETVSLPEGVRAEAVTFGRGWIAVVTDTNEILILDPKSGALHQRVAIEPGN
ncbi:DUF6476 family protein [Defluviimonas sp. SAOS-178_SWC]|uniref:DUF6476 family protein n=1 Tax=Defluviimonas sp. SAOS-178_SWC TaxID=3121287 RepID=UPI003221BF9C